MKQQNSEPQAEQLHGFPKVKSFLSEPLKFYQKQATVGQKQMRLYNSKNISVSCLSFNKQIISIIIGSFLYSDINYLKYNLSKTELIFFLEITLWYIQFSLLPSSLSSLKLEFHLCVDLRTKPSLLSLFIEQYPQIIREHFKTYHLQLLISMNQNYLATVQQTKFRHKRIAKLS